MINLQTQASALGKSPRLLASQSGMLRTNDDNGAQDGVLYFSDGMHLLPTKGTNIRSFLAYWSVFLSNIRVASVARTASEVDCLLLLLFPFFSFFLVVFSGVSGGRFFRLSFSGGQHFGRRLTTVLHANPRGEDRSAVLFALAMIMS